MSEQRGENVRIDSQLGTLLSTYLYVESCCHAIPFLCFYRLVIKKSDHYPMMKVSRWVLAARNRQLPTTLMKKSGALKNGWTTRARAAAAAAVANSSLGRRRPAVTADLLPKRRCCCAFPLYTPWEDVAQRAATAPTFCSAGPRWKRRHLTCQDVAAAIIAKPSEVPKRSCEEPDATPSSEGGQQQTSNPCVCHVCFGLSPHPPASSDKPQSSRKPFFNVRSSLNQQRQMLVDVWSLGKEVRSQMIGAGGSAIPFSSSMKAMMQVFSSGSPAPAAAPAPPPPPPPPPLPPPLSGVENLHRLFSDASQAMRCSVAAYGAVYDEGFLFSLRRGFSLFASPSLHSVPATPTQEQRARIERMLGASSSSSSIRVVDAHYPGDKNSRDACSAYFIAVDDKTQQVILAFRGSSTVSDVLADVRHGHKVVTWGGGSSGSPAVSSRIPLGFYQMVHSRAIPILRVLRQQAAAHPNYRLLITGHSLGAAQATLFHLLFCLPQPSQVGSAAGKEQQHQHQQHPHLHERGVPRFTQGIASFAFAPPPFMEPAAAAALQEVLNGSAGHSAMSFGIGDDIVTRLQSWALREYLLKDLLEEAVKRTTNGNSGASSSLRSFGSHVTRRAATAAAHLLLPSAPPSENVELVIPGELFFLEIFPEPSPALPRLPRAGMGEAKRKQVVLDASLNAIRHHLPLHYLQRMNVERAKYEGLLEKRRQRGGVPLASQKGERCD